MNYIAVGLAALAAFFIGFFWYTIIFAKPWQSLIGVGNDQGTGVGSAQDVPNLGPRLAAKFAINLVMAGTLAFFVGENATWLSGLGTGILVGFAFVALPIGDNYLFSGKALKLWLIDAGHGVVVFGVMGMIIGAM